MVTWPYVFFFKKIYFYFFRLRWAFIAVCRLSLVDGELGLLCRGAQASHCVGFSCGAQALGRVGFSGCGAGTLLIHSMWDLLRPGMEPMFPALTGRFLSSLPLGKSCFIFLHLLSCVILHVSNTIYYNKC